MIKFTLTPDHGDTIEVEADSRDIYVWERTGKGRSLGMLADNVPMVEMYPIAHITCKRLGEDVPAKLEDFAAAYALDWSEDDDATDPTQPEPLPESSSRSRSRPASPRASGQTKARARSRPPTKS